eukprot:2780874-Prymnesium_polylepis.1
MATRARRGWVGSAPLSVTSLRARGQRREARALARPIEAKPSSSQASIRLLLPLCACHGSYGCQIERVVKSSDMQSSGYDNTGENAEY